MMRQPSLLSIRVMKEAETENILVPCIIDRILKNNMRHAKVCNEIIRDPGSFIS